LRRLATKKQHAGHHKNGKEARFGNPSGQGEKVRRGEGGKGPSARRKKLERKFLGSRVVTYFLLVERVEATPDRLRREEGGGDTSTKKIEITKS